MQKLLGSSVDPEKLSLTIKSVGVWAIPGAIALATLLGWNITKVDLVDLVNNIAILVASAMTVFGLARKIYYKIRGAK